MQLFTSQQLRQKQSLVITTQLQQAIRLLQMSNVELQAFLESQVESNPFLEVQHPEAEPAAHGQMHDAQPPGQGEDRGGEDRGSNRAAPEAIDAGMQAAHLPEDGPVGEEAFANQFETGQLDLATPRGRAASEHDGADPLEATLATPEASLFGHVCAQIDLMFADPAQRIIALALADALEPSGWLGQPVGEIAAALGVDEARVLAVLDRLQGIEPAGLFARSLAECLRLQAAERGMLDAPFAMMLNNLPMLAEGQMKPLARLCGVSPEGLRDMLRALRRLDPKPGACFARDDAPISPPDLVVRRGPDGWIVDLNRSTLPSVVVNRSYAERVLEQPLGTRQSAQAEATRGFARDRMADANWLRRAIAQRNATTLKIGAEIVRHQSAFLEHGAAHLRPLVLREVAEAVGVHESTVSRVTSGLLMATPRGTYRLKSFFSAGLGGSSDVDAGGDCAAAVKHRIRKLIEAEHADAPLSDDALVRLIAADGIKLARRTAAKYREMLSIPSSFERRRRAVMAGQI
jgi:RNA polymerase sigma-54 factor